MSETPRLSRKALREQGKLTVRPVDAPALTETQELRLRRPTRKEMREAERAEREQNLELERVSGLASTESQDSPVAEAPIFPQRTSVFDRFVDDTDTAENTSISESEEVAEVAKNSVDAAEETTLAVENAPEENVVAEPEVAVEAGQDTAEVDDFAQLFEEESVEADAETGNSLRDRFFSRLRSAENEKTDSAFANPEHTAETELALEAVEVDDTALEAPVVPSDEAETEVEVEEVEVSTELPAEPVVEEDAETGVDIAQAEVLETEVAAEELQPEAEVTVEAAAVSKWSWFIFIVMALIVAVVGYLAGSWIHNTFIVGSTSALELVVTVKSLL